MAEVAATGCEDGTHGNIERAREDTKDPAIDDQSEAAVATQQTTWRCHVHGVLARDMFYPSVIKSCFHACKTCIRERNKRYVTNRSEVYVASDARARERKRRASSPSNEHATITAGDVSKIFGIFGKRCFLTKAGPPLTLVPVDPNKPLSVSNAVPVRRSIARLAKGSLPSDMHARWAEVMALTNTVKGDHNQK